MTPINPHHSTGYAQADHVVQNFVSCLETVLPNRMAGIYVEGSYADGTAVATSDLDLLIVFRGKFVAGEKEKAEKLVAACARGIGLELDVALVEEAYLGQAASPMFKLGARLLYGEDVRETIPLIPLQEWARQRMHAAYWLAINVFQRPKPVRLPLSWPQPQAPFYGYTERTMQLADGTEIPTTRNLIRVTGWIATARIAHEAGVLVVRKRDCVPTYRRTIGDEWTELLEQIDQRCRTGWQYRIPATEAEQAELRTILERTLAYENHFLARYRRFLLEELQSSEPAARQDALRILADTPFEDPVIDQILHTLRREG